MLLAPLAVMTLRRVSIAAGRHSNGLAILETFSKQPRVRFARERSDLRQTALTVSGMRATKFGKELPRDVQTGPGG